MLGCDVPADPNAMFQMAIALSRSTILPGMLRGSPENVLAIMMIAQALQLPTAIVWQNVYPTGEGEVGHRSRLLHMLLRRAGHRFVYLDVTDEGANGLLWIHGSTQPIEVSYTFAEAFRLGLTDPHRDRDGHWERQPANMCRNRLLSRAVDWHVPEVKAGADFTPDGGLLVAGLAEGDDPIPFSGLGPEVTRLLLAVNASDAIESPADRVAALRGTWSEAQLLLDVVVDNAGQTLSGLISARLTAAKAAELEADAATGKRRKRKTGDEQADPVTKICGCPVAVIETTGAHLEACASAVARMVNTSSADRR